MTELPLAGIQSRVSLFTIRIFGRVIIFCPSGKAQIFEAVNPGCSHTFSHSGLRFENLRLRDLPIFKNGQNELLVRLPLRILTFLLN